MLYSKIQKRTSMLGNAVREFSVYRKVLQQSSFSNNVKDTQYAVRGAIPMKGEEIKNRIKNGDLSYPFKKITPLNIGNPQAVGQGVITYNREVLSSLIHPDILNSDAISEDAKARAKQMLGLFSTPVGAYTSNSKGHAQVR
jgi:alanine transaminase